MANDKLKSTIFPSEVISDWHMTFAERCAYYQIISHVMPKVAIEIGTFRGGSLAPLSRLSEKVYTFDIDANQHRVNPLFPNVEFVTGDTRATLPPIIKHLNETNACLEFILIDGSHETDGVTSDVNTCLQFVPKQKPLIIAMHDSSNPAVRAGILNGDWNSCPYVHALDLDFVPGMLYDRADIKDQIWGGLGVAVLMPEPRKGRLSTSAGFGYSLLALGKASDRA